MSGFPRLGYPAGLIGATAATRYVGATIAGAPVAGTFQLGDFIIDQTGAMYFCTAAGSPGVWAPMAGIGGSFVESNDSYAAAGTPVLRTRVAGDPNPRYELTADGKEQWGDGTAALDTSLYRDSASVLGTDGGLRVNGPYVWLPTAGAILYFGGGADVHLYRSAANQLKTDNNLLAAGDIYADVALSSQVYLGSGGPSGQAGVLFGLSQDTNLYRFSANLLATDDQLWGIDGLCFGAQQVLLRTGPTAGAGVPPVNMMIAAGTGAPNNANGFNGDFYLRSDGGALTTIYQKRAGAWVGIV